MYVLAPMLGCIRVSVSVGFSFLCFFINACYMFENVFYFSCYMFVYMYMHFLTPPACGLSFICNKVIFCSVQ